MRVSSFGASVGSGPVHCVLLDVEDGHVVGRQARTIDPGPYRLGRRGNLLSSGFDLLAGHAEREVEASAVTVRSRRDLLSVRLGARGGVRRAGIVRDADAVVRGLGERGSIARYESALVADLGVDGLRLYTVRDGAVTAERRSRAVVPGGDGVLPTDHLSTLVRSAIAGAPSKPEALAVVGTGALNPAVREAVSAVARAASLEPVVVDEPETIVASGAALLAADRRVAGRAPSSVVNGGIGVLGGNSVRLTAAILPLLVVAALTGAVLATGYATGIIGPAGRSTEEVVPTSADSLTPERRSSTEVELSTATSTATSTLPPVEPSAAPPPAPEVGREAPVTPTMTTFAPPPVLPTATRPPTTTVSTPPAPTTTGTLPTTILPTIPTGTHTPPPSGPSVSGSATGSAETKPPTSNGLVAPSASGASGAQGTSGSSAPSGISTGPVRSDPSTEPVEPQEPASTSAVTPTVTEPAH